MSFVKLDERMGVMTNGGQERDRMGRTAVHDAAMRGDVAKLCELLAGGADPDAVDAAGWTPLHFAAQAQDPVTAEALLSAGALADVGDQHGCTALWRAVFSFRGEGATLGVLLEAGADPDQENAHGVSPRGLAGRIANYDAAAHLPRGE
ncbi:ankyrin repeat domain-containing protein [Kitasatospora sp. NPDC059571]|uniref:ankyrin repeat domain-containing protein n=1 Tax=Kitasatospora sp. NPDC059571 TaxID=3346871 RepID=UPI0036B2D2C5